ncbi:MAG: zeta toxin family protein [Ruminococcus sp.]|nr:zeta toxin family protein [Ruminococcus sp.]
MSRPPQNRKPEIIVFAGPNGSGKSTITQLFQIDMDYINADDIKKSTLCTDLEAAQKAEQLREEHLSQHKDFCFETVLSTDRNLKLLKKAKENGYFIKCVYILTALPDVNVMRVRARVIQGGHGVPEDKIRSRYHKSLELIKEVIPVCDICHIYDNSDDVPFRIFKKRKSEYYYDENEFWSFDDIVLLTGISQIDKKDLNIIR